jgi:ribonucleoside-diphosphate reductase alpha chain
MTKRKTGEPVLTANSMEVLRSRYLLKDKIGTVVETPGELFWRVAHAIANTESRDVDYWSEAFYDMMSERRFIPNTPTLVNAGKRGGQLSACFVLPIHDSLDSIFDSLKFAAKIHQSGGGTGFAFSQLRPRGSLVRTSHGVASGPVSFMRIFDIATETIKQGGTRRGANMAILRVDHPDILEFIQSKTDQRSMVNFNISVGITDEFMEALREGSKIWLKDPRDGQKVKQLRTSEIFNAIVDSAWRCGDPGLVFLDRINLFNPTPHEGDMESTNPCGEQPLLSFESCNLGSLNLGGYYRAKKGFDWNQFRKDIGTSVRFLDNVIDENVYPLIETKKITLRNRKIGLGVMGFADLLLMEGIPYSSNQAVEYGEQIMSILDREAKVASAKLAHERGPFPNWKGSMWHRLGYSPMRNSTVSTVAPTGSISIIAGASSGIEPIFSGVFYRNILDGKRLIELHPMLEKKLENLKYNLAELTDKKITELLGPAWSPAWQVPVERHVKIQAAFQRHSDSAVSKTINLPESATRADVASAYKMAFQLGCKGITVYRDKSRSTQVLEASAPVSQGLESCPSC